MADNLAARRHAPCLTTILYELCPDGKDALVAALGRFDALAATRLASRALRDTVDGSLLGLTVYVEDEDVQRFEQGHLFPLSRLQRLRDLTLVANEPENHTEAAFRLLLPFEGQPAQCLQRIARLELQATCELEPTVEAAAPLASLLHRLTGLRHLTLNLPLSIEPRAQRLMALTLSSLPHLEELYLPYSFPFTPPGNLGALAANLKHLSVGNTDGDLEQAVGQPALEWLAANALQLQVLETVCLEDCEMDEQDALLRLLQNPPPRLRSLEVSSAGLDYHCALTSGRLDEVRLQGVEYFDQVLVFVRSVLQPLGAWLRLLRIGWLHVNASSSAASESEEADLRLLPELARWCGAVQVGQLRLSAEPACLDRAARVMGALGRPGTLAVGYHVEFSLGKAGPPPQQQQQLTPRCDWSEMDGPRMVAWAYEWMLQQLQASPVSGPRTAAGAAKSADTVVLLLRIAGPRAQRRARLDAGARRAGGWGCSSGGGGGQRRSAAMVRSLLSCRADRQVCAGVVRHRGALGGVGCGGARGAGGGEVLHR